MEIIIVGSGKLAETLIQGLSKNASLKVIKWNDFEKLQNTKIIIIHAGSGRQLNDCIEYCKID